jgi:hypothetical protein
LALISGAPAFLAQKRRKLGLFGALHRAIARRHLADRLSSRS